MSQTPHPYYTSLTKRLFDSILAAMLLFILSPFLSFLAIAVYVTVGHPVLFAQERTGQYKKPFKMLKFRTMRPKAENDRSQFEHLNQAPYPMFKIFNDPRFVGIGKWLSQTGFDELPQLINILKGDMSFVGPRPLPTSEATQLDGHWDFRYQVRPGIFSYWTLSKHRHKSLQIWKKLEEQTLSEGGSFFELNLIAQIVIKSIAGLFTYGKV